MFQHQGTPEYAGFWIRFLAYLIDTLLMTVVLVPLAAFIGAVMAATADENGASLIIFGLVRVVSLAGGWLYFALLESSPWQASVGKKALGLRVTDLNGNRIAFGKATGRYFGKVLSGLILFIGFIMAAFSERKQALHDQLAGTLVVKGGAMVSYPIPPPPPDFGNSRAI